MRGKRKRSGRKGKQNNKISYENDSSGDDLVIMEQTESIDINSDENSEPTIKSNSQNAKKNKPTNTNPKVPSITRTLIGSYAWGEKHKIYLPGFPRQLKDNYLAIPPGKLDGGISSEAQGHPNHIYYHDVYFEPVQVILDLAKREDISNYDIVTDRGNIIKIDAGITSSTGHPDFILYLRKYKNLLMVRRGDEGAGSLAGHLFEKTLCQDNPFLSTHVLVQCDVPISSSSSSSSSSSFSSSSSSSSDTITSTSSSSPPTTSTSSSDPSPTPSSVPSSVPSSSTPPFSFSLFSNSTPAPPQPKARVLIRAEIDASSVDFVPPRKKTYETYKKSESNLQSLIALHEHPLIFSHLREIKMAKELKEFHHFQSWLVGVKKIVHGVSKQCRRVSKTVHFDDYEQRLINVTEKLLSYSSQMAEGETYLYKLERKNFGPMEFEKVEYSAKWLQV